MIIDATVWHGLAERQGEEKLERDAFKAKLGLWFEIKAAIA